MAKRCDVCGAKPTRGAKRSHSNRQTLKRQYLNLQSAKIDGKATKLCARCLKTTKKPLTKKKAAKATAKKK